MIEVSLTNNEMGLHLFCLGPQTSKEIPFENLDKWIGISTILRLHLALKQSTGFTESHFKAKPQQFIRNMYIFSFDVKI